MDLNKEEVWVCSQEADGIRYIFSGTGKGETGGVNRSGDIVCKLALYPWVDRYARVK
jgi:hypothetical protein